MAGNFRIQPLILVLAITTSRALTAQPHNPDNVFSAAELRGIVETLSHDSLVGRPTPSPGLEVAARYVARRFRDAGLTPLGDDGGYLRRYPVLETVLDANSARIEIGSLATWRFGADFWYAAGGGGDPSGILRGSVVIVTGAITPESAKGLDIARKVVVYVSPLSARGAPSDFRSVFALMGAGAVGVVIPGGRPDSTWRAIGRDPDEHKPSVEPAWAVLADTQSRARGSDDVVPFIPALELWGGRFGQLLRVGRVDSASLHSSDGSPKATPLNVDGSLVFARRTERVSWPSNIVGMLRGSDPALRDEYVVVTAHVDGLGVAKGVRPGPQAVLNGADDNASGVAGLIQMARMLSSASVRPRRSVIFAAVSGEERGLWGSDFLASRSPVPIGSIVANVNLDMIGRATGDTVYLVGKSNPALVPIIQRTLTTTKRRRLVVLDENALDRRYPNQRLQGRSDHASFTRRGVPALWLFTGSHPDYHATTDDAGAVNYNSLGRISNFAYDLMIAIANTLSTRAHRPAS